MASNSTNSTGGDIVDDLLNGNPGAAQDSSGIATKAFFLNLAFAFGLFAFQLTGFFLLKSSGLGRRIYQPKTYLVQDRLRVEAIPVSPLKWIKRIFAIEGEELKLKCGLDGYFAIRFLRAMVVIFLPLMAIVITVLLPVNYNGGVDERTINVNGELTRFNVTGLDTLSWTNVAPAQANRYWAHLVCALLVISWTLYRVYREKLHFTTVRQQYLTSPEHRLKASARTILVTNIPSEYQSEEKLKALFDVFVWNDDRSRLHVWVNRDYRDLRALVNLRHKLTHQLEKEELSILRRVNKKYLKNGRKEAGEKRSPPTSSDTNATAAGTEVEGGTARRRVAPASLNEGVDDNEDDAKQDQRIAEAFEADCQDDKQLWHNYLEDSEQSTVNVIKQDDGSLISVPWWKFWLRSTDIVPKIAYLRAEIAHVTPLIENMLQNLDKEALFKRQNSAFIQFDRQMSANMACALVAHHKPGCMAPRFLHVAPHEIIWPNMGLTSFGRFRRKCICFILFAGMLFLWGIPTTFLGILSQLQSLREDTSYLKWLKPWPSWLISLISGPLSALLLALLIQLVVPALCRKLAVNMGTPTRSRREVVTQSFYFVFLFIELVLVTSISSGFIAVIGSILDNPVSIVTTLAKDLPKAANYFFNYLTIQALGFSGSVLFQYLRLLFITFIWPFHTQTPRKEVWLQTTIPHQMWANVFSMWTNFAVIGLIYSVIAPLVLVFISAVFCLFWIAYRHNYYYVQRNKVDTHGLLFEQAFSQLLLGVYVLEIALIGLFFLVRNAQGQVACTPQAIIMIIVLCLTAIYNYSLERVMAPLRELVPVTLEDTAAEAEQRFLTDGANRLSTEVTQGGVDGADDGDDSSGPASAAEKPGTSVRSGTQPKTSKKAQHDRAKAMAATAANARKTFSRLSNKIDARLIDNQLNAARQAGTSRKRMLEAADQLGKAIARYPDELIDLTPQERHAELRAAYQDPVTREPQPVVWIPEDPAGISEDSVEQSKKYGRALRYSNAGAYLTKEGKCNVTQLTPDVRSDWLLDWVL
ncbi:uncharacterized protein LTR77_001553 [Saxophila tyrrhenica]|uniref:DUF221-domain-containing protein n=1 Tax=Saxophila tyrrhenica TaxID=1690608 RepID=A0AAV9PN77_9PEZI|nr:hypothetical protein LTR77_001553 [Saxophila tyrrhenica]